MPPRTIVVAGASGLVGSALLPALEQDGHRVLRLVRQEPRGSNEIRWSPSAHLLDERQLASVEVIVNLSGETIGKRWTASRRRRIRSSRINTTDALVTAIGTMGRRPVTLINASAIGVYGNRADDLLDETQPPGRGFLAEICKQWEQSARAATRFGARVVVLRTGLVLSRDGGALPRMLTPFKLGIGGRLGNGRQWMSWITLDDLVRAIVWIIDHPEINGAVNVTTPNPVTNQAFTKALGGALHRPSLVPVPAFLLKVIFGEMAEDTLLVSQRAEPRVLVTSGFEFESPTIAQAFDRILGTSR